MGFYIPARVSHMDAMEVPLKPIISEPELAIAWLAQRGMRPTKTKRGRYAITDGDDGASLGLGAQLLIVENLGIDTDGDLLAVRREIESHPRWTGE